MQNRLLVNPMNKIKIYTDGACKGNPGNGGWGAVIILNDVVKEIKGYCKNTTNNKMELLASIMALRTIGSAEDIEIYTDSMYLKNGITNWIHNWKKNNWLNSSKKIIKNKELWEEIDKFNNIYNISWIWVKAHNGDFYNERADELANIAIKEMN